MMGVRKRTAEYIYNGKPCKRGHIGPRYKSGNCVECLLERERQKQLDPEFSAAKRIRENQRHHANPDISRERSKRYWDENREELIKKQRESYANNRDVRLEAIHQYRKLYPERVKESHRKYHARNREKRAENHKKYREANREILLVKNRILCKEHYEANKEYYWHKAQKRRAVTVQATPVWADLNAVKSIVREARFRSEREGMKYSVDHIIPLRGKNNNGELIVCGLHWEGNLQVMLLSDNKSKSYRVWPDMPGSKGL